MRDSKEEVEQLCSKLQESTKLKRNGKCIKFTNNAHNTTIAIDSWKFLDFDYGKDKVQLPIQARGLFTTNNDSIVVRGYDKFFNVGEKSFTKEDELKNTSGPYGVTLKENGCIIFISGLPTGDILVCSKHSTGLRDDNTRNHALEGEAQLRQQLGNERVDQLARYLYENNVTAVTELCDDEFEEHVLPYPKDKSGLYLHGLNYNTIKFQTVPIGDVVKFAHEWGFKTIEYLSYDNVDKLFDFLHKCSETGTYNGREVEGFVIRCKRNGDDFFFKYKFEEPYLLYRQFREVTRQMLGGTPAHSVKIKKNKYITKKYLEFVDKLFTEKPELKEDFQQGHGIIHVRQLFLQDLHETNGMNLLSIDAKLTEEMKNLKLEDEDSTKLLLVSISTLGCGKTTVFNTLHSLFPDWVHIQNDNVSKKAKLKITDLALQALDNYPVVIFDRNNSEYRERKQIFTTIAEKKHLYLDGKIDIKYIGINFIHDVNEEKLWKITFDRVKKRGDNHQSLKAASDEELTTKVMKGFMSRFQPVNAERLPDSQFDHVINLKLNENDSSLENVKIIIDELSRIYPELIKSKPTDEEIEARFRESLEYKPTFTKDMTSSNKKKDPTYYGISIHHQNILDLLNELNDNAEYSRLKEERFLQESFHVTLGHIASAKGTEKKAKWKCIKTVLGKGEGKEGEKNVLEFHAKVKLIQFVINRGKLICIKCEILTIHDNKNNRLVDIEPVNRYMHITIGCFPPTKPVDSNTTLEELYGDDPHDVKKDGVYEVDEDVVEVRNLTTQVVLENQKLFAYY
ncbi:Lig1 tRNA ligase [Candida orthopsilosis Co 90-125]|uniref:tRNA ligase n=1 Tax=Candida orthopsilosis (strain 90-125) TaxID=1136231 RepID=H8XAZ7_CANO9|nr:Lig1 tRNA ligase [Candida orthopsilosis Co 90-125]CCG25245.1 Lig1 tRNA ligase [Candida orthopsilosis Co 90-125]